MKKTLFNKIFCLCLMFVITVNSFAAVVADNDGSAFITKAEFDSLKNNFQAQLDQYNTSIDSKIDNAISSYLAGIKTEKTTDLDSLLNKCNKQTYNNRDNRFINSSTISTPWTQTPSSSKYSFLALYTHGVYPAAYMNQYDLIRWGTRESVDMGRRWHNVDDSKNCFYGLALTRVYDTDRTYYMYFDDPNIYKTTYISYIVGNQHAWESNMCSPSSPTSFTAAKAETSDTRWCSATGGKIDWAMMRKDIVVKHSFNQWGGVANGTANQSIQWSQYYQKTIMSGNYTDTVGYNYESLPDINKIYYVDQEKWYEAVDSGRTNSDSTMYGSLTHRVQNQTGNGRYCNSSQSTMTWYEYFHDVKQMNVNNLGNHTATNVLGVRDNYVKFYEGLPLCKATSEGIIKIKLKAECYDENDAIYTGTWIGKLYLREENRFNNTSTTTSNYKDKDGNTKTGGIIISSDNKDVSLEITCKSGSLYWVKYVLDTTDSGLKVQLDSTSLIQESKE